MALSGGFIVKMPNVSICSDCPRNCAVDRSVSAGFCGCGPLPSVVRAAPHFGEEPCISGVRGSGAVFFSGCNLRCVYCQNCEISRSESGTPVSSSELADIMLRLQDTGVHNINLVTGSHHTGVIAEALEKARLSVPVVWNSSGYEKVETLRMLDGLVDVYLPDYKYASAELAGKYSYAADYPEIAANAVKEMFRQRGRYLFDSENMIQSGVIIRHLILPGEYDNTRDAIDFAADSFPDGSVLFSLMSQYTPMRQFDRFPELNCTVTQEQSETLRHYMLLRGLDGYFQDVNSSGKDMIPDFKENKL